MNKVLGVDIGGSGIKSAIVNVRTGKLLTDVLRIKTPSNSTPTEVALILKQKCEYFNWKGKIGIGFPGVIQEGYVNLCNNLNKEWLGLDAVSFLSDRLKRKVTIVNDVDAAGIAEMYSGAGKDRMDKVLVMCIGTGIGTALFYRKKLFPNSELGQLYIPKHGIAEKFTADSVRKKEELKWKEWGKRLNIYLNELHAVTFPNLIILSGGVSKKHEKYEKHLKVGCPVEFALHKNTAGIIGAALAAAGKGF